MKQPHPSKAFILTALAPLIWSTGGIGVRVLNLTPATILFWRSVFTTVTLLLWGVIRYRKDFPRVYLGNIRRGWPVGAFMAPSFIFYILSVTRTTVAASLLIQGTAPMFIVLLGWAILRDVPGRITLVSLLLVMGGIAIIVIHSATGGGLSGNMFGVFKALSFALAVVFIRRIRGINHIPAMAMAAFLAGSFALLVGPKFRLNLEEFVVLLYLGLFQVGFGFILFVTWSKELKASQTGLLVILEAVVGPVWPWLFLKERPSQATLIGGAVIILGLVLHSVYFERSHRFHR